MDNFTKGFILGWLITASTVIIIDIIKNKYNRK